MKTQKSLFYNMLHDTANLANSAQTIAKLITIFATKMWDKQ